MNDRLNLRDKKAAEVGIEIAGEESNLEKKK